jgi:hypothetical protein
LLLLLRILKMPMPVVLDIKLKAVVSKEWNYLLKFMAKK